MDGTVRTLVFWTVVAVSAFLLWETVRSTGPERQATEISYSTFVSAAQSGTIARVTVTGSQITGTYRDGGWFHLTGPANPAVYLSVLQEHGVEVVFRDAPKQDLPQRLLVTWAPILLLLAIWFMMLRRIQGRNSPRADGNVPRGTIDPSTGELR